MGLFTKGLKNDFDTAMVNEPSVFEPSKFYCITYSKLMTNANKDILNLPTYHSIFDLAEYFSVSDYVWKHNNSWKNK